MHVVYLEKALPNLDIIFKCIFNWFTLTTVSGVIIKLG